MSRTSRTTKALPRVVIYLHEPAAEGVDTALALDLQRQLCQQHAQERSMQIVAEIEDAASDETHRPGLQTLVHNIRSGEVDIVIIARPDVLLPTAPLLLRFLLFAESHDTTLESVRRPLPVIDGALTKTELLEHLAFGPEKH